MMQDFLFKASNISKYYGQNVGCKNISLDINSGEILGIVGGSGSGKYIIKLYIWKFKS